MDESTGDFDASIRWNRNSRAEAMEQGRRIMRPLPARAPVRSRNASAQECGTTAARSTRFRGAGVPAHGTLEIRSARFFTLRGALLHRDRAGYFAWRLGRNRAAIHTSREA